MLRASCGSGSENQQAKDYSFTYTWSYLLADEKHNINTRLIIYLPYGFLNLSPNFACDGGVCVCVLMPPDQSLPVELHLFR